MKEKPNEWIAIADLMAGMMAVVVLLLVISVLQKSAAEMQYQQSLMKEKAENASPVKGIMYSVAAILRRNGILTAVTVNKNANGLVFHGGVFAQGSACLSSSILTAIKQMRPFIIQFLKGSPHASIVVEGYTNDVPIMAPVTDRERFCAVYDDNVTLSAARANAVRHVLLGMANGNMVRQVVVAAYGDTKPLPGVALSSPKNRRVNVLFVK